MQHEGLIDFDELECANSYSSRIFAFTNVDAGVGSSHKDPWSLVALIKLRFGIVQYAQLEEECTSTISRA